MISSKDKGIRCWLDERQILPGDDLHDEIDKGIKLWDKTLICCSQSSLNKPWVDREITKAVQKEEQLWKKYNKKTLAIIPLDLDNYIHQWESGKVSILTECYIANFQGWEPDKAEQFEGVLESVVKALKADEGGRERPPKPLL